MYTNLYIILLDATSIRDMQINRIDDNDEGFHDWNGDVVIDKVEATSLDEAIEMVSEEYEIKKEKLYGYPIVLGE